MYTNIAFPPSHPHLTPLGHHRALSWAPCGRCLTLAIPGTVACQGISQARILVLVGNSPGNLPDPGIEAASPALLVDFYFFLPAEPPEKPDLPVSYGILSLAGYFTHGSACMSMLLSVHASLCFCRGVHMSIVYICSATPALQRGPSVPFSGFHICALIYGICFSDCFTLYVHPRLYKWPTFVPFYGWVMFPCMYVP